MPVIDKFEIGNLCQHETDVVQIELIADIKEDEIEALSTMRITDPTAKLLLGNRIRTRRKQLNLKQCVCAELADLSQPFLSLIESNKRMPSLRELGKLSKVLDTTPVALVGPVGDNGDKYELLRLTNKLINYGTKDQINHIRLFLANLDNASIDE